MKPSEIIIEGYRNLEKVLNDNDIPEYLFSSDFVDLDYRSWSFRAFSSFSGFPPPIPFRFKIKDVDELHEIKGFLDSFLGDMSLSLASFILSFFFPLTSLIQLIGIDHTKYQKQLSYHNYRNIFWVMYVLAVYIFLLGVLLPIMIVVTTFPFIIVDVGVSGQAAPPLWVVILQIAALLSIIPLLFLWILVPLRLTFRFVNRYFAETICIRESLHLLLDLRDDNVFYDPDRKKILQYRVDYLAKATLLIASRYASKDKDNLEWIETHFKKMESYIQEREKWIIAPGSTTLKDLRDDFTNLLLIYLNGEYGRFSWDDKVSPPKISRFIWLQNLGGFLIRFLGVLIPLAIMGVYLWQPSLFPYINVDPTIITILLISWLLLAIDTIFKLGVVSDLVSLAKGFKDLS